MDNVQWQRRLEKLFTDSPELQDALSALEEAEQEYKAKVLGKLFGYQAISNCFQGFTANTVSMVENQLRKQPRLSRPSNYILLLLRMGDVPLIVETGVGLLESYATTIPC